MSELQLPTRKNDDWKYTNLKTVLAKNYALKNQTSATDMALDKNFHHVIFSNGELTGTNSLPNGLTISLLERPHASFIGTNNYFISDYQNLSNQSAMDKVYLIKLDKSIIDKPIKLTHQFGGALSQHTHVFLYEFSKNTEAQIIEEYISDSDVSVNLSNYIRVEQNAKIEHILVQKLNNQSLLLMGHNVEIARDAHYNNVFFHTGSRLSRNNLYLNLAGENAIAQVHGLYAIGEEQHHDTLSYIRHSAPHSYSHQLYKGILDDKSRGIFTGRVRVEKDAQLIEAEQLNKNLLLTSKAHANSRPQMEINADDVKCAHGSTTGQLSEDELFYFEARGIEKERARKLLAKAFAFDVVLKIKNKLIRDEISQHLHREHIVS